MTGTPVEASLRDGLIKKHTSVQTFVLVAHILLSAPQIYPYGTTHIGSKITLSAGIYLNL